MGILSTINIDKSKVAEQEVFAGGAGVWDSGLYNVTIVEAYLSKTKNGNLTKMQIKIAESEEKQTFTSVLLLDGNGEPYKAKTGTWKSTDQLVHLLQACGLEDSEQKEGVIKMGNEDVKVIILSDLIGKKLTIGVRKCEDTYKESVPYINNFEQFFRTGYEKDEAEKNRADKFLELIAKAPIKKAKAGSSKPSAGKATGSQNIADLL
jgi:hypothetical protein